MQFKIILQFFIFSIVFNFANANPYDHGLNGIAMLIKCHEMLLVQGVEVGESGESSAESVIVEKDKIAEGPSSSNTQKNQLYAIEPYFTFGNRIVHCLKKFGDTTHIQPLLDLLEKIPNNSWIELEKEKLQNQLQSLLAAREKHKMDNEKLKETNQKLEFWRKHVATLGIAFKQLHYFVAEKLLNILEDNVHYFRKDNSVDVDHYLRMKKYFLDRLENNEYLLKDRRNNGFHELLGSYEKSLKYSFLHHINYYRTQMEKGLQNVYPTNPTIYLVKDPAYWWIKDYQQAMPKVKRILWLVRHAERMDNIQEVPKDRPFHYEDFLREDGRIGKREFWWDNSPLSQRGKEEQAPKLENVFKNFQINHIFASPMERTVDTAHRLLGDSHEGLQIKLEPGLVERLDFCRNPPSYETCEKLESEGGYGRLNCKYSALFRKKPKRSVLLEELNYADDAHNNKPNKPEFSSHFEELQTEREGQFHDESDVLERVESTLEYILKNYRRQNGYQQEKTLSKKFFGKVADIMPNAIANNLPETIAKGLPIGVKDWLWPGEEEAEHIVIVSHGAVIGAVHQLIANEWAYVAQASISKFVEYEHQGETSVNEKQYQNFRLVFSSETKHLGNAQRRDLRQ